jgi:D-cysteine desulfhydrase
MLPALFQAFPELGESRPDRRPPLRHLSLGQFPTAIERIAGPLPGGVELWVKREDQAGDLYGGNKVRRLEFLFANQLSTENGADSRPSKRILTIGAYGSNHVLATGLYGRALGYSVEAVLYPQPITDRVRGAVRAAAGAGIALRLCRTYFGVPVALAAAKRQAPPDAPPAHLVFPGGVDTSGALGWWSGGLEIAAQVATGQAPRFDAVYVALGAGDTTTGLLLGLGNAAQEIVGVRVVPWPVASGLGVRLLARRVRALLSRRYGLVTPGGPTPRLRVEGGYVGRGYGHPTPWGERAIARAADFGLSFDPTYTGKVFAALLADAEAGRLRGKRVLFIHTFNSRDTRALVAAGDAARLPGWLVARPAGELHAHPR